MNYGLSQRAVEAHLQLVHGQGRHVRAFGGGTSLLKLGLRAQPWLHTGLLEQGTALTPAAAPTFTVELRDWIGAS